MRRAHDDLERLILLLEGFVFILLWQVLGLCPSLQGKASELCLVILQVDEHKSNGFDLDPLLKDLR